LENLWAKCGPWEIDKSSIEVKTFSNS
jgi:hypothetical protein